MARLIVLGLTRMPWACSHSSQWRSKLTSGCARSWAPKSTCTRKRLLAGRPGITLGLRLPVLSSLFEVAFERGQGDSK
jgi:hypothetical protein